MKQKEIKKITMYSTSWCGDCMRAKMFFDKHKVDFEEIDIDTDTSAAKIVEEINDGNKSVPTIIFEYSDGSEGITVEPNFEELEEMTFEK